MVHYYCYNNYFTPLTSAYQDESEEKAYADAVFNELSNFFNGRDPRNELTINFYLMIMDARRAYLWDVTVSLESIPIFGHFLQQYGINTYVIPHPKGASRPLILSTRKAINLDRFTQPNWEMYLAHVLEFGCIDPEYGNVNRRREAYHFYVKGDKLYYITTFVCTLKHRPTKKALQQTVDRFQRAINKLNSSWKVFYEQIPMPPIQQLIYMPPFETNHFVSQNNVAYLQTSEGDIIAFPTHLIPYSVTLQRELAHQRGTSHENPLQVNCGITTLLTIQDDLEQNYNDQSIPVERYNLDTLQELISCSKALRIDLLTSAYEHEYREKYYAISVFNELSSFFESMELSEEGKSELTINFYLVIMGARKAFLWFLDEEKALLVKQLLRTYDINTFEGPKEMGTIYLSTRGNIDVDRFTQPDWEMYLAKILEYGCIDPEFWNENIPRESYSFYIKGDKLYHVTTFICTQYHLPTPRFLQETLDRFQRAINKVNPSWSVYYKQISMPSIQELQQHSLCRKTL